VEEAMLRTTPAGLEARVHIRQTFTEPEYLLIVKIQNTFQENLRSIVDNEGCRSSIT
jgi:hypothetical protein